MNDECYNLDDYLAGDLDSDAADRFHAHLRHCEACREAETQQRWIDGLLTSPERLQLEPAPRSLIETLTKSPTHAPSARRRYAAAILAVAAVLFVASGLIMLNRDTIDGTQSTADVAAPTGELPTAKNDVQPETGSTFIADSNAIAVPVDSHRPGVTIVRVYPTFQPRIETQTASLEPTYSADLSNFWTEDSNGG